MMLPRFNLKTIYTHLSKKSEAAREMRRLRMIALALRSRLERRPPEEAPDKEETKAEPVGTRTKKGKKRKRREPDLETCYRRILSRILSKEKKDAEELLPGEHVVWDIDTLILYTVEEHPSMQHAKLREKLRKQCPASYRAATEDEIEDLLEGSSDLLRDIARQRGLLDWRSSL